MFSDVDGDEVPSIHGSDDGQYRCCYEEGIRVVCGLCDEEPFLSTRDAGQMWGVWSASCGVVEGEDLIVPFISSLDWVGSNRLLEGRFVVTLMTHLMTIVLVVITYFLFLPLLVMKHTIDFNHILPKAYRLGSLSRIQEHTKAHW